MHLEYRYFGPDSDVIGELPDGVGAAMGSEYCVHLLPSAARMSEAVREAAERSRPAARTVDGRRPAAAREGPLHLPRSRGIRPVLPV